ncbi:MAG: hypothetical protein KC620_21930 [Myxococcales bacterium]|nr:hypothetical protein [Myxococcales bacterium]
MVLRHYRRIVETCEPYLVARGRVQHGLNLTPLRIPIPQANIIDPQRQGDRPFLRLLKQLNEMTYGPTGMSMPDWVFYDCTVMPGAVFGFARRATNLERWFTRALNVPEDYTGLVPLSMFACIPTVSRKSAMVHTLCSINQVAAGAAPEGLWRLTLASGTHAFRLHHMLVVSQWRSPQLGLYAGLGPLELLTAWTPAHDYPGTCTFRVATSDAARRRLLRGDLVGPEGIDRYVDADSPALLAALQVEIEAGRKVAIVGPAEIRGADTRVPLQYRDDAHPSELEWGLGFTRRFQG